MKKVIALFILLFPSLIKAHDNGFEKNLGQVFYSNSVVAKDVEYVYRGATYDAYFLKTGVSYVLKSYSQESQSVFRTDLELMASNKNTIIESNKSLPVNKSYLTGNYGKIHIKEHYQELIYKNIYEGIDLKFYIVKGAIKFDFILSPFANIENIKYTYKGADLVVKDNEILVKTPLGILNEKLPLTYQPIKGKRDVKEANYKQLNGLIKFEVEDYDRSKKLIIDPWSTFVGGVDVEESFSSCTDNSNNVYVSGYTSSSNFPTTVGVLQTTKQGFYDSYLTKLDTTGNVIWSTFYGGTGDEYAYKTLTDTQDNVYLVGYTNGNDLLVSSSGVFQTSSNGSYDAFILKLDSAGNFIWATYYGGGGGDFALSAGVDDNNNIVIGGYTSSPNLPMLNAFQGVKGGALDAYVAKFDSTGNLLWSTYCGGTNTEDVHALHIDNQNNVIISGETFSSDFPTSTGAFQSNNAGGLDIFLSKYDSLGTRVFSTYIGGLNNEDANGLSSDLNRNIYLIGYSESLDFPMIGTSVYQASKDGGKDGIVVRFTETGIPVKSTFVGGGLEDRFTTIDVRNNKVYLGGFTNSNDIPLLGFSYQSLLGGSFDGMYYRLDTSLTPNYSTYIGGNSADYLYELNINLDQLLVLSGKTSSQDFPVTSNVFQDTLTGQSDAFVFVSDSTFNVITNISKGSFIAESNYKVYPNPIIDNLILELPEFNKQLHYKFLLYDVNGKEIEQSALTTSKSELRLELNTGIYFYTLLVNNEPVKKGKLLKE